MSDRLAALLDWNEKEWRIFVIGLASLTIGLFFLYRAALPRPIPGIPYNEAAAMRILGDGPDMKAAKRPRGWMKDQFAKHNSPIVQIFMSPFQKPWILVSDFEEAHDIMLHRNKEFDRSGLTADCFSGIMPEFQMNMKSADPRFKHNKDLVKDLMTPKFLNEVSAPELYEKMLLLVNLWSKKATVAAGKPFRADLDIYMWALDITMAVTFNFPRNRTMMAKQLSQILEQGPHHSQQPGSECFEFDAPKLDEELEACVYLANSVGVAFRSPFPRLAHWLYLNKPYSRKQMRIKRSLIRTNIERSLARLEQRDSSSTLTCAVDQILLRQMERANRAGHQPDFHEDAIYDELFGFIVGGHDTTSTTFQWWVKYMSYWPKTQIRMREELHSAHQRAIAEKRLPSLTEILRTEIPYLDAMIAEAFRYSHIVPFVTRETIADTEIFGHRLPKNCQILFGTCAESFIAPRFEIADSQRRVRSNKGPLQYGVWDSANVGTFEPERWLEPMTIREPGVSPDCEAFNPRAGPALSFGAGPRGCFGRRLAYLEMRLAITMLIWKFEFLGMGEELGSLESVDTSTEAPKVCYVALREIEF